MTYEIQTYSQTNGWHNIGWTIYPDGTEGPLLFDSMNEVIQEMDELMLMGCNPAKYRVAEA